MQDQNITIWNVDAQYSWMDPLSDRVNEQDEPSLALLKELVEAVSANRAAVGVVVWVSQNVWGVPD